MLTTTLKNNLADAFKADVTHVSLHTDDPGTTGANDSGVTHAAITWGSSSAGVVSGTAQFNNLTVVCTHIGLWEGATFRGAYENAFTVTDATVNLVVRHEVAER